MLILPWQLLRRLPHQRIDLVSSANTVPSLLKLFSTQKPRPNIDPDPIAQSLSSELLQNPDADPQSVSQRLNTSFSHVSEAMTPLLVQQTLDMSPAAGRTMLGFHRWLVTDGKFQQTDEIAAHFIDYFGRKKDFNSAHEILVNGKDVIGSKSFKSIVNRLVRAGRPTKVVGLFDKMETDYGFKKDKETLTLIIHELCDAGYASYAEKMVKNLGSDIYLDNTICDLLIMGWCVDGKLEEAKRLARELYNGGYEIGVLAYNSILDCVCKLCRKKDPFKLHCEAEKVLTEMDARGIPRNVVTFNVLIGHLCKMRKTQDALKLFYQMEEWKCCPDDATFLFLIRSLYLAARVEEGDEMMDRMKRAGYGDKLDKKAYYGFLKILCGIERIEHAMRVFQMMKADKCKPGVKTYDLLMGKWGARHHLKNVNALFKEALNNGVPVTRKVYKVDPKLLKKPTVAKKVTKKRETFAEKMARKRARLKQIRLSFVKKPKKRARHFLG